MSLASAFLLLFLVIDPLGNIPFFLSALKSVPAERQSRVMTRELVVAYLVMVAFLFIGQPLLGLLGVTDPALTIAGGVVLFLIAIRMVFPPAGGVPAEEIEGEPFIVPLAIPYVAGPSVLATLMLLVKRDPARWPEWLAALTLAWAATAVILVGGTRLRRYLTARGMIAIERLMGMVLVTIAVQMFLTGVQAFQGAPR